MIRDQALTVEEVSACLGLSPKEIRRRIRRGDLKALNVGGRGTGTRYRILPAHLTAYQRQIAA